MQMIQIGVACLAGLTAMAEPSQAGPIASSRAAMIPITFMVGRGLPDITYGNKYKELHQVKRKCPPGYRLYRQYRCVPLKTHRAPPAPALKTHRAPPATTPKRHRAPPWPGR